jgi:hypothetical protein
MINIRFGDMFYKLASIFFTSDLHGTRVILSISEMVWALTLFWPGVTFDRPTYKIMAEICSEEYWAFAFLVSSIIQFYLVIKNKYHSKFAQIFAGANSLFWWFVVIAMYNSVSPPPAAISGELGLAIGASWIFIRSGYKTRIIRGNEYV